MLDNGAPKTLDDFKGQEKVKRKLKVCLASARIRNATVDPVLITARSGMGKSTLASIIANECGKELRTILCSTVKSTDDLINVLIDVQENEVVFLDEIHSLTKKAQEVMFSPLECGKVNAKTGDGQFIKFDLPQGVVIIAATTDADKMLVPLRNRFTNHIDLISYDDDYIAEIIMSTAQAHGIEIDVETAKSVAFCCRGVPRQAKSLVCNLRDFAMVLNNGIVDYELAAEVLEDQGIDISTGLNNMDRQYLKFMNDNYANKPVGVNTIASSLGFSKNMVETVIEPYLINSGYIVKSIRGRSLTQKAIEMLN